MLNDSLFASASPDWETPASLYEALDAEFCFDLDPCATEANAKCGRFYTAAEDGLLQSWNGAVYVNPPYGRGIDRWLDKALHSANNGATVVCLVPARTDTKWWHRYCMQADEIRFLNRRLTFAGADNKATFPGALVVFRPPKRVPVLLRQMVAL
jgi:phage N-6-adenine-methyltransferase